MEKLLEQFTGGATTFREFKREVVKLAWKLGFRAPTTSAYDALTD